MGLPRNLIVQLTEHIKKNIAKGYTLDALKFSLIDQGYSRISVEKSIELANQQLATSIPEMKEKPKITYKLLDKENNPIKTFQIGNEKKSFWKKVTSWFG